MSSPLGKSVQRPLIADTSGEEIQRSLIDLLSQTRGRIEQGACLSEEERDEIVHQTRVDMKRLRALLYMIEGGLDKHKLKSLHRAAQALATALSGQRDYKVMLATLDNLDVVFPDAFQKQVTTVLENQFLSPGEVTPFEQILQMLDELYVRISATQWFSIRRCHLLHGLERTGTRGQRLCRRALDRADVEALHRWRKWVKVWMYQLHWLLAEPDKPWMLRLKPLGAELGRVHDLDVLADALSALDDGMHTETKHSLDQAITTQRKQALVNVRSDADSVYSRPARLRANKVFRHWCST